MNQCADEKQADIGTWTAPDFDLFLKLHYLKIEVKKMTKLLAKLRLRAEFQVCTFRIRILQGVSSMFVLKAASCIL